MYCNAWTAFGTNYLEYKYTYVTKKYIYLIKKIDVLLKKKCYSI